MIERKVIDSMKLFEGKKGLILGVANDRSIAWAIAKEIMDQGGTCGFSHLPDKPEDEDRKSTRLNSSHEWISRMPSSA